MDSSDAVGHGDYIHEFQQNIARAMSTYLHISDDRKRAIVALKNNCNDSYAIDLLKRCTKNERWLLSILENGLRKADADFAKIQSFAEGIDTKEIMKQIPDENTKKILLALPGNVRKVAEIKALFLNSLERKRKRLELEDAFVKNPTKDYLDNLFIPTWIAEIKFNKKLVNKIAWDDNTLKEYFSASKTVFNNILISPLIITSAYALGRLIHEVIDKTYGQGFDPDMKVLKIGMAFLVIQCVLNLKKTWIELQDNDDKMLKILQD